MKTTSNASKTKTSLLLPILLIGSLWAGKATAQSTDIDNPTPITSNTLEGMTNPDDKTAFYYSICVKRGILKVTADLTSEYGGSMVYFIFLNNGMKEIATNDFRGEEHKNRTVKEFRFSKAQKLILKLTFINLTTDSKFTFDGAINTSGDCNTNQLGNPRSVTASAPAENTTSNAPTPHTSSADNPLPQTNAAHLASNYAVVPTTRNATTNRPQIQNGAKEVAKYINNGTRLKATSKTNLKQLTDDGSKIGIYVLETIRQQKPNTTGNLLENKIISTYFVQLPNTTDDMVYGVMHNKFSPQFNEKVWQYVQDKPALAAKIKNKEKGFFYPAFTSDKQRLEVWQNIAKAYNMSN